MTQVEIYSQQGFTPEQQEMLHAPLDATQIKQRPGAGGRMLKYIKGDTAIDTANKIFGFGRWGYKVVSRGHEVIIDEKKGQRIEFYTADIELSVFGCAFPFPGDGVGIVNSPTVEMHEKARKEASTDALKRALRHYGDQFGLCLYDEDDYVAMPDGTMAQVKDIKPVAPTSPRRVVESRQQPARIAPPATKDRLSSSLDAPRNGTQEGQQYALLPSDLDSIKARWATAYGIADEQIEARWPKYLQYVLQIAEPDLKRFHLKTIERDLEKQTAKQTSKAS